jgi:hypothetical protein
MFVMVHLDTAPPGTVAEVKQRVQAVVQRTFRSHVDRVDVSF